MASVLIKDKTANILRGILTDRGMSCTSAAKAMREPKSTVSYRVRHAEDMPISVLRGFVELTGMTDEEIVRLVRGGGK